MKPGAAVLIAACPRVTNTNAVHITRIILSSVDFSRKKVTMGRTIRIKITAIPNTPCSAISLEYSI